MRRGLSRVDGGRGRVHWEGRMGGGMEISGGNLFNKGSIGSKMDGMWMGCHHLTIFVNGGAISTSTLFVVIQH